jgi:hypothetical protein
MAYKPEKGGRIMEVYARGKYLTNMEWTDYIGKHGWSGAEAAAKADGWSGVHDTQFESAVAVWDPKDIKSATGNNGEFGENANITKSLPRPTFYSQLELAIEGVPDRLATMAAPQWKLWLDANAGKLGVKKDEIEWSGVLDYLKLRGKDKVSRDELAAYVRENGVQVKDVVLGERAQFANADEAIAFIAAQDGKTPEWVRENWGYRNDQDYIDVAVSRSAKASGAVKFQQYTLPGGENYREVLITLPNENQKLIDAEQKARTAYRWAVKNDATEAEQNTTRNALVRATKALEDSRSSQYKSSHWDAPNVLAHIRVDDRVDAEGRRVLFLNEIQSDFAQEGRKKGFRSATDPRPAQDALRAAESEIDVKYADYVREELRGEIKVDKLEDMVRHEVSSTPLGDKARHVGDYERIRELFLADEAEQEKINKALPAAPFVQSTNAWVGLALKRAIMIAIKNGQDKVAWVTGEQAAGFFDLSKQVDEIGIERHGDLFDVFASREQADGMMTRVIEERDVTVKKLEEIVGKDIAKAAIEKNQRTFRGNDLKVGGSGMGAFYDTIVPQVANDVLKKIGGGKVEEVVIDVQEEHVDDSKYIVVTESDGSNPYVTQTTAGHKKVAGPFETLDEAYAWVEKAMNYSAKQPGFSITPSMREKLQGGAPQFSKARDVEETPEFKKWFGDSKAVDSDGKPLVVYHGSKTDKSEFAGAAQFFSADPDYASQYADTSRVSIPADRAGNVMPVYLSLQNPKIMDDHGEYWDAIRRNKEGALIEKYRKAGHDGIIVRKFMDNLGAADMFITFKPTQIKSAISGGAFDPSSADITRSAIRDTNIGAGYKVADFLDSSKKVSWWDRSVGTPYHLAERHPTFKRVYDAVQNFIGDVSKYATRAADLAPNILPKLEHMADVFKSPLSAEDVKALGDPIFLGTLSYTRDKNDQPVKTNDVGLAGIVWHDDELKSMWNLDDRQIKLYREFRRATNKSIADMAITHMVRYGGADVLGVREAMLKAPTIKIAAEIMANELGRLAGMDPARANTLMNTARGAKEIAQMAQGLIAKGYAPLSRFGDYTVYITRNKGKEQVFFGMYETEREANKAARAFREDILYKGADIKTGTMSKEAHKLFKGITPETLALFGEALGLEESASDQQSQVFQEYLKLAKTNRGAMKHMIERKGISGYSEDAGRVLAAFVYSNARQSATNLHAGEILKAANDVQDGDAKDMAIRLAEYSQNPQEEAATLRGMLFAQFIGGSVASALVNTTQSFTTTWPTLSMHFGIGKAGRAMGSSLGIVKNGAGTDADLAAAMKRAEEEGITAPQETHQLMAQAQGRAGLQSGDGTQLGNTLAKLGNSYAKVKLIWGKAFSYAEILNRKIAFVSAYKLAREKGMADPFEFAKKIVADTQFTLNKGNNPAWARGPVGATLFVFRKFMVNYVEGLARMWTNGAPGSPERAEGRKAFVLSLAILFILAGADGFPFQEDLEDVIDGFMQRVMNKSFSSKAEKRAFFAKVVGDAGTDFVMNGVSGLPGVPMDFSGRLGLGNILPSTGLLTKKQDHSRDVAEITGAAGAFAGRMVTAAGALAQGDVRHAVEAAVPIAISNALKAKSMAELGYYQDAKGRKVISTDAVDAAFKLIGFQPQSVAKVQEATGIQQSLIAQNKIRETELADLWARGRIEKKPELVADAKRQRDEWNLANPHARIEIDESQINKRVQQANMTKAQRLTKTAPKEIRQSVKEALTRE